MTAGELGTCVNTESGPKVPQMTTPRNINDEIVLTPEQQNLENFRNAYARVQKLSPRGSLEGEIFVCTIHYDRISNGALYLNYC